MSVVFSLRKPCPFVTQAKDSMEEEFGKNLNKEHVRQEVAAKVPLTIGLSNDSVHVLDPVSVNGNAYIWILLSF